jgi:CubicO group peptidase (beta-lactamase class C family)
MKHIALGLSIVGIMISCGAKQPEPATQPTSVHKDTAVTTRRTMTAEEFNRISTLSENFYGTLVRTGMNGGFLVAKNDSIVFERYNGYERMRKNSPPVGEHSAFHLASVSKTFTAMVVLKLMEEGKINLDTSVQAYLPAFPYPGITVRMLLNHRSGLPNYLNFIKQTLLTRGPILTNEGLLSYLTQYKPQPMTRPGTHFHYCNTNYAMLALIVEKVTGTPFPQYVKETIFDPLGMKDTYICTPDRLATAIPSYDARGRQMPWTNLDGVYGDKNVYSTVRDLLKWDAALRGNFLSKATLEQAYKPYSLEKPGIRNYGLGWHMFLYPSQKVIFHNGYWHGNNAVFFRLLDKGYTIIATNNRMDKAVYRVQPLAEALVGYKFNDKNAPVSADPEEGEQ